MGRILSVALPLVISSELMLNKLPTINDQQMLLEVSILPLNRIGLGDFEIRSKSFSNFTGSGSVMWIKCKDTARSLDRAPKADLPVI